MNLAILNFQCKPIASACTAVKAFIILAAILLSYNSAFSLAVPQAANLSRYRHRQTLRQTRQGRQFKEFVDIGRSRCRLYWVTPDNSLLDYKDTKNLAAWIPASFDEACKRNAGRRKLHMRKRQSRADRIARLLAATDSTPANGLRATHGSIVTASGALEVSKPTASRDFALVRRIHRQFVRMFGRNFDAKRDRVVWTWNWAHYGFSTWESKATKHKKPVGHFPFDTA